MRRSLSWTIRAALAACGVVVAVFAIGVNWPEREIRPARNAGVWMIEHVDVVDVARGQLLRDQSIVWSAGTITDAGPASEVKAPAHARRIDGRGRTLMPALWDMHTHLYAFSPLLDMPLYVAYGVTHVRDLQGCPSADDPFIACAGDKQRWSREALAGERVGPVVIESSSFMANGPGMVKRLGDVPDFFDTGTPDQARAFVRHFAGKVDTIKVYDRIPAPAWRALVDEARKAGMPVVGHRPHAVSAIEAARGQRSLEHARFLLHESFDGSDALRAVAGTPAWHEDRRAMVDRHDPRRADAIFAAMRANGTYYVPTHLTRWVDAYADRAEVREDPALRTLHPLLRRQWREDIDETLARDPSPAARQAYVDFHRKGLELTGRAQRAGVRIMVGTDYIAPGLDVHRELEQLVRAGLTPVEALRAATTTPAEYAGLSHRHGRIARGHAADFLLLDRNPLEDIRHTRRIRAVVFNGAVHDRAALDGIQREVESRAGSWTVACKIIWRFLKHPVGY
nr:amidohydrolase family protein [Pseudoxanthomonas sp.]